MIADSSEQVFRCNSPVAAPVPLTAGAGQREYLFLFAPAAGALIQTLLLPFGY